jgi:hypothetical protein
VHKRFQDCNWLQNLEGEVDSSHAPFLHGSVGPGGMQPYNNNADRHPIFQVLETEFGLAIAARREAGPEQYYWRVTPFMLPFYTIVPAPAKPTTSGRRRCRSMISPCSA